MLDIEVFSYTSRVNVTAKYFSVESTITKLPYSSNRLAYDPSRLN